MISDEERLKKLIKKLSFESYICLGFMITLMFVFLVVLGNIDEFIR